MKDKIAVIALLLIVVGIGLMVYEIRSDLAYIGGPSEKSNSVTETSASPPSCIFVPLGPNEVPALWTCTPNHSECAAVHELNAGWIYECWPVENSTSP